MMPVSSVNAGASQPLTAAGKVLETPKVQKTGEEVRRRPVKPAVDKYVPAEKQEPSGRYWLGRDGSGQPKIYFDGPGQTADGPEKAEDAPAAEEPGQKGMKSPEKKEKKEQLCVGNTGKVDREIAKLKKKQRELEQRLNAETDEVRIKDLERRLAQVERELSQKDTDAYRRRHSTFTRLS